MKKPYEIQDFINHADDNGFVELSVFSKVAFKLKPEVIASYFDKDDQFYNEDRTKKARENIRYTITFEVKPLKRINPNTPNIATYRAYKGGIHKDDLEYFIEKVKISIEENEKNFDDAYQEYQRKRYEEAHENLKKAEQNLKKKYKTSLWRKLFGK